VERIGRNFVASAGVLLVAEFGHVPVRGAWRTQNNAPLREALMSTILVCEDQTSVEMSVSKALSKAGFCVHCEREARRVIAAAEQFDFNAVIVADALPGLNGLQVVQSLRARDPELPIFVYTTYDEESVARWAVQERTLVLEKPVDEVQLIWLLEAHVGRLT
jgi:DNA-binding response OmpR family regulator